MRACPLCVCFMYIRLSKIPKRFPSKINGEAMNVCSMIGGVEVKYLLLAREACSQWLFIVSFQRAFQAVILMSTFQSATSFESSLFACDLGVEK